MGEVDVRARRDILVAILGLEERTHWLQIHGWRCEKAWRKMVDADVVACHGDTNGLIALCIESPQ